MGMPSPPNVNVGPSSFFAEWMSEQLPQPSEAVRVYAEKPRTDEIVQRLAKAVINEYVGTITLLKLSGFPGAAEVVRTSLPTNKKTRSGDLGEIIGTEFVNTETTFRVPITKVQWKDDRQMPMRGNDIIGIDSSTSPPKFLKGECKSRSRLNASTVAEAAEALDKDDGRLNPSSVGFIIKRLYEDGRDAEAGQFRDLIAAGQARPDQITHLVFAFCGNAPTSLLLNTPAPKISAIRRYSVGATVTDHSAFIDLVFGLAHAYQF